MSTQPSTPIDTLIFAPWIITADASNPILENHAIALCAGKITALLPAEQARELTATDQITLTNHALMPGLINAHGHAAMSLFRGMADDLPLHTWLNDHIWPAEGKWVSEEFVRDGSALAIAEMLRSGTTCFSDMYFFPEIASEVARLAGVRAQFCFPIFDFPSAWGNGPDDYISKGLSLIDQHKHSELIHIGFGPHAPYTVGNEAMRRVATLAAELDAAIQIHVHETQQEVDDALTQTGKRPLARLAELGILGPKTQCVHLSAVNDEDTSILARYGCHAIHCPSSNLKLASGFSPIEKLRAAGINVALGSDGAASNNSLDLFSEMRSAALLGKAVAGDAAAIPDNYAIEMATINGARALGIAEHTGSLEVGKDADLIAVDMSDLAQQPVYNAISQLVYTNMGHRVKHSWIKGRRIIDNGELKTLDTHDLTARAKHWRKKISGE